MKKILLNFFLLNTISFLTINETSCSCHYVTKKNLNTDRIELSDNSNIYNDLKTDLSSQAGADISNDKNITFNAYDTDNNLLNKDTIGYYNEKIKVSIIIGKPDKYFNQIEKEKEISVKKELDFSSLTLDHSISYSIYDDISFQLSEQVNTDSYHIKSDNKIIIKIYHNNILLNKDYAPKENENYKLSIQVDYNSDFFNHFDEKQKTI